MLKEFTVGFSRTINLGNYESARIEATVTVEVGEQQDFGELRSEAQTTLRSLLEETYRAQHKNSKAPY